MKILVTGANGFVGHSLCAQLKKHHFAVRAAVRRENTDDETVCFEQIIISYIGPQTNWQDALADVDCVIHLAARVHIMADRAADPLAEFRRVNRDGTIHLAQKAARLGVRRFIYLSSIKVNGEETFWGQPFTADDPPAPVDPYGISKLEAERGLRDVAQKTDIEVVIIRPPLVYGPGVKGNLQKMMRWLSLGVPLPLGAVHNQRSLIGIDNLVDFIITCIDHPVAANQTFLIADGEDLSTTELLRRLTKALGKPARLLPVPAKVLELGAALLGRREIARRLCGNLQIDISKARNMLGWEPPVPIEEGLKRCVEAQPSVAGDNMLIRLLDIIFSASGLILGLPFLLLLAIIGLFDTGSPIFRQERVGREQKPFILVKFRTMKLDTASVASHLASASAITRFGLFLRRTKLDELPQLWNVLKGEMSLIGPRPCLFNQEELIRERARRGVYAARPGITGLAQINDIDMSTPKLLAETDARMLARLSMRDYFRYIALTIAGKGAGDRVKR